MSGPGGFKVIGLLKRPAGMEIYEFRRWWLTDHAAKVRRWPGLTSYTINLAVSPDEPFDGVAEVWFDSEESAQRIFGTPEGAAARGSLDSGTGHSVVFLAVEHVIVDGR